MATFQYRAIDSIGAQVTGSVDAASVSAAQEELERRGLTSVRCELLVEKQSPDSAVSSTTMSSADAREVTRFIAHLSSRGLPLVAGLRAAARECDSRVARSVLDQLANQLDAGGELSDIAQQIRPGFPRHIAGAIAAAVQSNQLSRGLGELMEHHHRMSVLLQRVSSSLIYPVTVVCIAILTLGTLLFVYSSTFETMYNEFELQLPSMTRFILSIPHDGPRFVLFSLIIGAVVLGTARATLGKRRCLIVLSATPIFGPLWQWYGWAEWCGLMSLLVRRQIPLPRAIELATEGSGNSYVSMVSSDIAKQVAAGSSLAEVAQRGASLPASLLPLLQWGERCQAMSAGMDAARQVFERRVLMRTALLRSILPPMILLFVGCCVLLMVTALFSPLISLISGLS